MRTLETDSTGRTVTAVVADVEGSEQRFTGSVVVVSAGAANSAKLLLASANDKHPNGLANGSDQVGRNYVFHNSRAFLAVSMEKNDTRFQKTLGLNDYYFGDDDFEYPMGNVQMVGKSSAPMYRGEKPIETTLAPTFALSDVAERAVDFWLSTEDLPDPDNRVTLRRERQRRPALHAEQPGAAGTALPPGQEAPEPPGYAPAPPDPARRLHEERHPGRWLRSPGRHRALRDRPSDLGPRHRLQGARARQPLRRRHQLLPEHRSSEPGAHRHGQCTARWRPPGGTARLNRVIDRERPRWRPEPRTRVVNLAGLVQGITLVTFPAASSIFTDPSGYDLSGTQYGAMFLPQVLTAITTSLLGVTLVVRLSAKRVLLMGLARTSHRWSFWS